MSKVDKGNHKYYSSKSVDYFGQKLHIYIEVQEEKNVLHYTWSPNWQFHTDFNSFIDSGRK